LSRLVREIHEQLAEAHEIVKQDNRFAVHGQIDLAFSICWQAEELICSTNHLFEIAGVMRCSAKEDVSQLEN
jgi:hypothetical protein